MSDGGVAEFLFGVLLFVLLSHSLNNSVPVFKIKDAEVKCANNGGLYDIEIGFFYDEVMCKNYATFKLPNITQWEHTEKK